MLFSFRLRDLADIEPFGGERPTLHWFGLTDGWYWLTIGESEIFRFGDAFMCQEEPWRSDPSVLPYVDYYVVRLWEDLLEQLPAMLAPVPASLADRIADADGWCAWQAHVRRWLDGYDDDAELDAEFDLVAAALGWWGRRQLDTGYLRDGPRLWCWRVHDTMHLRWDNRDEMEQGYPVWAAQVGDFALPVHTFLDEVRDFDARFIAAMGERVDAVRVHWPHPNVSIDLDRLAREQPERAEWLARSLERAAQPDAEYWRAVLEAIARVDQAIAPE